MRVCPFAGNFRERSLGAGWLVDFGAELVWEASGGAEHETAINRTVRTMSRTQSIVRGRQSARSLHGQIVINRGKDRLHEVGRTIQGSSDIIVYYRHHDAHQPRIAPMVSK